MSTYYISNVLLLKNKQLNSYIQILKEEKQTCYSNICIQTYSNFNQIHICSDFRQKK